MHAYMHACMYVCMYVRMYVCIVSHHCHAEGLHCTSYAQSQPQQQQVAHAGAEVLATLKDSSTLHTLDLLLSGNQVGYVGAEALATLKNSAALHTLNLSLGYNRVASAGAEALATLKDSSTLHTLDLLLAGNQVGDAGAEALATLKDSTALHTLSLNLMYTHGGGSTFGDTKGGGSLGPPKRSDCLGCENQELWWLPRHGTSDQGGHASPSS